MSLFAVLCNCKVGARLDYLLLSVTGFLRRAPTLGFFDAHISADIDKLLM